MSNETTYTERAVIRRERAAYIKGVTDAGMLHVTQYNWSERAASRFPFPTITRPREVEDPQTVRFVWTVIDGELRVSSPLASSSKAREWGKADGAEFGAFHPTPLRVALWADLLARPTETVEDR